jgi:hypothetical protein
MGVAIKWSYSVGILGGGWKLGLAGIPTVLDHPIGTLPGEEDEHLPSFVTIDGTHQTYRDTTLGSDVYVTDRFWKYSMATRTLQMPNGWTATYNWDSDQIVLLAEVRDPYGNRITPQWMEPNAWARRLAGVELTTGGVTRTVTISWGNVGGSLTYPTSLTFVGGMAWGGDRTWTFDWNTSGSGPQLARINMPIGPPWRMDYGGNPSMPTWVGLTTPNGGWVTYGLQIQDERKVVATRVTGGRAIVGGFWSFKYGQNPDGAEKSGFVHTPLGRHIEYRHRDVSGDGIVGANWVLVKQAVSTDAEG